jgi:SPP1 family predicted phage head-tail adaptor
MRAGSLTKRVVLENPTITSDGDGGFTTSWTELDPSPVWAAVIPASAAARERLMASSVQADATHLVEMRYHSEVTVKTRLTLGTRYLQVVGPPQNVDEAGAVTRVWCVETIPDTPGVAVESWIQEDWISP